MISEILRRVSAGGLLIAFLTSFIPVVATAQKTPRRARYNVLFLISDDLRPELGAYGVPMVQTPNIDALAARSMRFDNAYAQYSLCNPSRTSILTGRYPTETRVMNNNDYFRRNFPDWKTLPQYFRENGYATLRSGKIFHGGIDDEISWTEGGEPIDPNIVERGNPNFKPATTANIDPECEEEAQMKAAQTKASNSDRIVVLSGEGETHGDYKATSRAISMLERYKDKPFFLALGLVKPHSPPSAPKRFFDRFDVSRIPLPVDFGVTPKAPAGFPEVSISPRNSDLFIGRDSTDDLAREMKRAYWASIGFVDSQIGRVLDALDKNGLRENTIVVFWGDHGYHLGEKGKWSKAYSMYEVGLRVPLTIAVPNKKPGATDRVVELVDLYRTLADLCGLPEPRDVRGASLRPIIEKPKSKWDKPAYSVVNYRGVIGKSVRTARWHYVEWDGGAKGNMLFEHPKDRLELKNLATDPKFAKTVAEMKALLARMP